MLTGSVNDVKDLNQIIKINEKKVKSHLGNLVRQSVEETLNSMLDAEADQLCQAQRYERNGQRVDTRAGSSKRKLHTQAGEVELTIPKLRQRTFETVLPTGKDQQFQAFCRERPIRREVRRTK